MGGCRLFVLWGCGAIFLCCCAIANAQEDPDEQPFSPGLIAEFQQSNLPLVQRLETVVAANWSQRPDERLRRGELFTVTYRGMLEIPDDGNYQLHVHGNGDVLVTLNGKQLISQEKSKGWESSAATQLTFGPLPIEVTFTARDWPARIVLFWSSDRFEREPIPARVLLHEREKVVSTEFEQGQVLARALRCEACHTGEHANDAALPGPALDALLMNRSWLVNWLAGDRAHDAPLATATDIRRRMPYLPITAAEAESIADWLLAERQVTPKKPAPAKPKPDPKAKPPKTTAELHAFGQQLLLTKGCLACHQKNEFGESGLFGGGDLTYIAAKRPREFFAHWLQSPAALNRDHRMPVFDLTAEEREALSFALSVSGKASSAADSKTADEARKTNAVKARELAKKHRCDQCHRMPQENEVAKLTAPKAAPVLSNNSLWEQSCALENVERAKSQPQFQLPNTAAAALKTYFSSRIVAGEKLAPQPTGEQLLIENNCLACHAREPQPAGVLPKKFGDKLVQLAAAKEELATQLASLTPPSLNSVGDKLTDEALAAAITRAGPAHRPYLQVQMPKFRLAPEQSQQLAAHLVDQDRIPDYERTKAPEPTPAQQAARSLAGKRLIGTDGFSCTACHQVGSVQPVKAPPNARGPTLSLPQNRLRKTWFDRWVRNPARIVPRMEMPSVQTPVRGVLHDNLHEQLAAVWQVLSTPGFEPPLPEPVRTLRFYSSEDNTKKQPLVVTDLIEYKGQTLERAALIGLPNRQNILFDFATNRLLAWTQGDLARQRTKGKNWYWEPAGSALLTTRLQESEFALEIEGEIYEAHTDGQWLVDPTSWQLTDDQVASVSYPLQFRRKQDQGAQPKTVRVQVRQFIEPRLNPATGLLRRFELAGFPPAAKIHWRLLAAKELGVKPTDVKTSQYGLTVQVGSSAVIHVSVDAPAKFSWVDSGTAVLEVKAGEQGKMSWSASYTSSLPADEYHVPLPPTNSYMQPPVTIAPGFSGERIALPTDIMPTALAWRPNGDLVIASLKGQVLEFTASSLKSLQPQSHMLADGLAAPYGIQAGADYVDVVAKYGLLRLRRDEKSSMNECRTIASGWGYTSDYHDWAVGLPCDADGNYYVALPCFQDNRVEAAKRLRGSVLKLVPREPTVDLPLLFTTEVLTQGHRFPMGMALNKSGELFVTDNQGNYNPFNELNHVQPGKHFGFVNKGQEKPKDVTPPTIDIPHPWTRSVNGICFLDTPRGLPAKMFGPLEGHLVGCEYDTRRLVRMSLQKVDGEYQGCAYPLTVTAPVEEAPLGPICCEVSPTGELFVGSLRDSGWGAANNIGEVIRIQVDPKKFGHGLAEMRAVAGGFELHFFAPVEKSLADKIENYSLSSYRRESTPAYGGNDIDRRTEQVAAATLDASGRVVKLAVDDLRPGHVYELRLKSLTPEGELFFPAEAHYTLRRMVK